MPSRATWKEWEKRVRAWRASGLPKAQFAQRAGVHPGTLAWWRWRLSAGVEAPRVKRHRRSSPRKRQERRVAFVEITPAPAARALTSSEERIELELGRVRLRIPERFEGETLRRLLDLLEARG